MSLDLVIKWIRRWIAPISSAILPGSGQLIQRHWAKGGILLAIALVISGMLNRKSFFTNDFEAYSITHILLIVGIISLAAWSAYDAYRALKASPAH